jgi:uncharacterized protein GlcG (DUF336 family)
MNLRKERFMNRAFYVSLLCLVLLACNQNRPSGNSSPSGTMQQGAAGGLEQPGQRAQNADCGNLPGADQLQKWLRTVPGAGEAGGFTGGRFEWAAIVDRSGRLCAVAVASDDASAAWPGSQAIAKAKAFTANAYSSDKVPMSTARLYTFTQPGHSLWGIAAGNPLNPECLGTPQDKPGVGKVCGGSIAFGGGLPLYKGQTRIGGLGVSGDTACADHEIAKRIRAAAGLDPPGGPAADDIVYTAVDGPSYFAHPLCVNTWRNGKKIGDEAPASGY